MTNSTPHSPSSQTTTDTPYVTYYGESGDYVPPSAGTPSLENAPVNELERLREILYGRKTKVTDDRLSALENRVRLLEEQFNNRLIEETTALHTFFATELENFKRQYNDRLERQAQQFSKEVDTLRHEFSERLETQEGAQAEALRSIRKTWMEQLDTLASVTSSQMRDVQQDLADQLHTSVLDQNERLKSLQTESRKRDESLRSELLESSGTLKSQKVDRREMVQILVELAHRLQTDD